MRILEEFGQRMGRLLAQVLNLADADNFGEAHDLIDQSSRQLIGLSTNGVVNMPDDVLLDTLQSDSSTYWAERAAYLSFLLVEDGRLYVKEGDEDGGYGRFCTALHLQLAVITEKEQTVVSHEEIAETIAELDDYHLPGRTSAALMRYYENQGIYSKAEDILFDWFNAEAAIDDLNSANPIDIGIAFYQRLLQKPDPDLIAGNLPRSEVEASLEELLEEEI
ncbi:MAG: hypothetical protein GY943_04350 [Chloroflexi bacterium]|nr:hypothetical protein [Chloroflexota bacterium]